MEFFEKRQSKKSDQAEELSKRFRAGLIRKRKIKNRTPYRSWSREFQKAIDDGVFSPDVASQVVDWYIENVGGEFIPVAYSAKQFVEKFSRIVAQMERYGESITSTKKATKPKTKLYISGFISKSEYEKRCRELDQIEAEKLNRPDFVADRPSWVDLSPHVVVAYEFQYIKRDELTRWAESWSRDHGRDFPYDHFLAIGEKRGLFGAAENEQTREFRQVLS